VWASAKALIYPSIEEDFGIVPVEAMAHGVPVIAYDSGALRESIPHPGGGVFFHEFTVESLINAMRVWKKGLFDCLVMRTQAAKFSERMFLKSVRAIVDERI